MKPSLTVCKACVSLTVCAFEEVKIYKKLLEHCELSNANRVHQAHWPAIAIQHPIETERALRTHPCSRKCAFTMVKTLKDTDPKRRVTKSTAIYAGVDEGAKLVYRLARLFTPFACSTSTKPKWPLTRFTCSTSLNNKLNVKAIPQETAEKYLCSWKGI